MNDIILNKIPTCTQIFLNGYKTNYFNILALGNYILYMNIRNYLKIERILIIFFWKIKQLNTVFKNNMYYYVL